MSEQRRLAAIVAADVVGYSPDAAAVRAAWSSSVAMRALRQYERGESSPRETARVEARANTRI